MAYYLIIISAYSVLIFAPHTLSTTMLSVVMALTAGAFLFSLYLLFAQAFLLRQWCIWCLLSAMLSIIIFIASLGSIGFAVAFLTEITTALKAMHAIGFILGLGGAMAAAFLFSKFLSDRKIDEGELKTLQMLSELIWLGLALTIVSQFALYVTYAEILAASAAFLVQTAALFIAAVMSAILMIIFEPFLVMIPFKEPEMPRKRSPLSSLRKPIFVIGALALSSWLFAFAMDYLGEYETTRLIFAYAIFLAAAAALGLIWERRVKKTVKIKDRP